MAKKKGKSKEPKTEPTNDDGERKKSEKEIQLQAQLDNLSSDSSNLRAQLEGLRKVNRHLEDTANNKISETADYALYMKRESERRSNQIISVNEMNKHEIMMIGEECDELNEKFEQRLNELMSDLEAKKRKLAVAEQDLESLDYIKIHGWPDELI